MNFKETLDFLYSMLPMYQRIGTKAYKKDLDNTLALLESLDNPHKKFKSIHIAGTNGKGTSAHGIASILQSAGYKTGLYTSPHLRSFTERIRVNGIEVAESFVMEFVDQTATIIEKITPSFFEVTVAMAFQYFAKSNVDIAVIETGLGGRLDSTNVITPEVALITNIGLDHTDLLGDTLQLIAAEKAGIMKKGITTVIGETQGEIRQVFIDHSDKVGSKLVFATPLKDSIKLDKYTPDYFKKNIPGILEVIQELKARRYKINTEHVTIGLNHLNVNTGLKGRFQVLAEEPLIIADVSHNAEGLSILFDQILGLKMNHNLYLVFGTVKDKDLEPIFNVIPRDSIITWSQSNVPRALKAEELAAAAIKSKLNGSIEVDVNKAIEQNKKLAVKSDIILITGSTFLISEIANL